MTDEVSGNRPNSWYDLFSRGARDWLRHNEKVRDAVRAHLPQVVAGADVLSRGHSTVRVPVRMLEHYRFRLRSPDQVEGVGQGAAKPGDRIDTGADPAEGGGRGAGGDEDGGIQYTLEFQVDDIVDWLWEEMQLPNLENRAGKARDEDWTREGWDRRGARSRLDRRRSLKESIKRQAVNQDSPVFTDEDLRYRQLAKREQPATQAVVFLVLDVSASMGEEHRKLAKSFFFWAVQGLRRQYRNLEVVFIAHTTEAWEFAEEEFFRVTGSGGTFMSTALTLARSVADERYSPSQYNLYVFYASDGENSPSDSAATDTALKDLLGDLQYCGFLEVGSTGEGGPSSDIGKLFLQLAADGQPTAAYRAAKADDIWAPSDTSSASNRPPEDTAMKDGWRSYLARIEALARAAGLEYDPVEFEAVPDSMMMEIAIYGLPVRMPHWSFGVRYIYRLVQHRMGLSRLFEVVFPGNPGRAYLARNNSDAENVLVTAHVLGHADFSTCNLLFRRSGEQVGQQIVEQAATHARQIGEAIEAHGAARVEAVLDAALALEQHVNIDAALTRPRYPEEGRRPAPADDDTFIRRFRTLGPDVAPEPATLAPVPRPQTPPHPERDLLWFIAQYAPELEPWERDIFLAVRAESFYFYPVFACQIMNEGWASYWHARLLREAEFLPPQDYVDAIKCHSDVVRPTGQGERASLEINPYHLGFSLWERIIEEHGVEYARRVMVQNDDFAFIRGHLTSEVATELNLFRYKGPARGPYQVQELDLDALHEALLRPKFSFGAPTVAVDRLRVDGTLELVHDHATDGRGLDHERSAKVLDYLARIWRRPIVLTSIDGEGRALQLNANPA